MIADRVWAKVAMATPFECWPWTAAHSATGYGRVRWGGRNALAHRVVYEIANGEIPDGMTIDHLCRRRDCCNPNHMEPVTAQENMRRAPLGIHNRSKATCPQGHPYSGHNLIVTKRGRRKCRECIRVSSAIQSRKRRGLSA